MDPPTGPTQESRTWALFCHLSPLLGAGFVGPLVIWLIKKDEDPFVDAHGKEALNFHIAVTISIFALFVIGFATFGVGLFLTIPATFAIAIASMVFSILGAIKASEGRHYRYPYSFRLIH